MHKNLLPQLLLLFACIWLSSSLNAQDRPNILVIIADDMGVDAMSAYGIGTNQPNTPFLDSLISEGILFQNAWGYSTCSPSRAAMLTGRYANKNGVRTSNQTHLRLSEQTLFEHIDSITNGAYADAAFGKWHLSSGASVETHPNDQGANLYVGNLSSGVDDYFNWERTQNGVTDTSNVYVTTHITNRAISWIGNQTDPWFVWMAHNAPHEPVHIPPDSLYTHSSTNGRLNKYMCMIESIDHESARLYNSLTQAQKDNTLVIFVGDNGTPNALLQGYPANHGKSTLYEGGIRVPMLMSGFGVNRINEQEGAMVSLLDIYSTIGALLGESLSGGNDNSFSIFPLLSDPNAPTRKYNYAESGNTGYYRTIRNEQYKLIINEDGSQELYDLLVDPLETDDLMLLPLDPALSTLVLTLEAEAEVRATLWSCKDQILNGIETGIDVGGLCNGCDPVDFISGNVPSGNYQTKTLIASDGAVTSPEHVEYRSKMICLEAGFDVQSGAEFLAEIDPCVIGFDDVDCPNSNATSITNVGCNTNPTATRIYDESVSNDVRTIVCNSYPNHIYRLKNNEILLPVDHAFSMDATPQLATVNTSVTRETGQPGRLFGVSLNGVVIAPAPAEPFIFENTDTGEYNWNWVYEPTMNQGQGADRVNLDCASAHKSNARGYHYHGNMFEYAEVLYAGISTTTVPAGPVQMGWASDGFPILYRYGPDGIGGLALLTPSYRLKEGLRPGDGVNVPCGSYNGKYTRDYEYVEGLGDLDACNGIERDVMLQTVEGPVTFSYFYVITDAFPQIGRCLSGTPDVSFD